MIWIIICYYFWTKFELGKNVNSIFTEVKSAEINNLELKRRKELWWESGNEGQSNY